MFITDIKTQFYDVILHHRVLVLVANDVDALCACKILQTLLQWDHVQYTLVPVSGKDDVERAYLEHSEQLKYVVLINCGGTVNILESLQPDDDIVFFICDSHRPLHLWNIYNETQIKFLMSPEDDFDIPSYEEVFRDDESDSDDSGAESDSPEPTGKRRRFDEDALERRMNRRQERRNWEDKRSKILFDYEEFSYYGSSAAVVMYNLAWKKSKDTNDLLWWAIVGLTDQLIHKKIDREKYVSDVTELNRHVARHNHRAEDEENTVSVNTMKISFMPDLQLVLYRHWSILESLKHSSYTACNLKLWTLKGQKKLNEFLADMGLPLAQCQQKFTAMDITYKNTIRELLESSARKFGLENITLPSFLAQYGFKNKFCAFDIAYAVEAVLEAVDKDKSSEKRFLEALDCLSRSYIKNLHLGLDASKLQLQAVVTQVQSLLDMGQVVSAGPFLYAFLPEGTPETKFFAHPNCLSMLARFALEAYVKMSKSKKAKNLPLVMTAPLMNEGGTCLVIGIPPLPELEQSSRNFFGRAFEQAAKKTNSRTLHNHFDSSIMELKIGDRSKFFDALISLLT
ncbi:cell division control protein 45 homolog [Lytechinus pictus]|uniref:cell division control protein 45 homolog n=1 Tax=Lytechinus pictus TaxID=7653 RepID=UPI0030B9E152